MTAHLDTLLRGGEGISRYLFLDRRPGAHQFGYQMIPFGVTDYETCWTAFLR